jgi:nucleoside-diphosphate-sugar epimerase
MAKKGRISLFGDGQNKINPIHGADLAEFCSNLLDNPEKEFSIGGPETFRYKEIAELAFNVLNKSSKISYLPVWMIRIILPLIKTFTTSKTYGPVEFMMSVMTMDVVGESYGKEKLQDFYKKNV